MFAAAERQPRAGKGLMVAAAVLVLIMMGAGGYWWYSGGTGGGTATVSEPQTAIPVPALTPDAAVPAAPAKSTEAAAPVVRAGRTYQDFLKGGGVGPVMIDVPAGRFDMGTGPGFPYFDERPRHQVTLAGFSISKYEVTFEEYDRFAAATGRAQPSDEGWGRGRRPVVNVGWKDAAAYAAWLSAQTGHDYRLASESQWEYATRAGSTSKYWWGDGIGKGHANCLNCGSKWDGVQTAPVGSFAPNPLGLDDTAGNAMEWVQDCYHQNYDGAPTDGSAWVGRDCAERVARGGSYRTPADSLRSTKRYHFSPAVRADYIGFRVVREK
jgi:formylglycine-generating enzyme required for sulfatase activity